jgi:hypothetical protein
VSVPDHRIEEVIVANAKNAEGVKELGPGACRIYPEAVEGPARIRYATALRAGLSPGFNPGNAFNQASRPERAQKNRSERRS